MYQYLKNSLVYHKNRPLMVLQDFSQIPVPLIGQRITSYNKAMNPVHPESEALSFYLLNHAFAELCTRYDPQEPMPDNADELANLYITTGNDIALRAAYYVLSIITREARHVEDSCGSGIKQLAKDKYGPVFGKFLDLITGVSESKAVLYMLEGKCDMPLGKYCEGMAFIFNEGNWSSAYGGKKWGNVAEQLRKAVCGEVSMEAFTDIVWTLRHNGGPIFNKGMQYHNDNEEILDKILDVQRSGQIPQLLLDPMLSPVIATQAKALLVQAMAVLGEEFASPGYVDWFKVEALGALSVYPSEKKNQVAKYGQPGSKYKPVPEEQRFYVAPDKYAKIVKRAA